MMATLLRKLLRDVRLPLVVLVVLLAAFQCLWAKITKQISGQLLPQLVWLGAARNIAAKDIEETIFSGPGQIIKSMIGGESISIFSTKDMLTIGYVHSVVLTICAIWAIGRASGAIVGEIDRGTMELLLAQPLPRWLVILAHFLVDILTIPILCLSLWAGNWIGICLVGLTENTGAGGSGPPINPMIFGPALWNVGALIFAISGYTMWLSAWGRFRWRVLGVSVLITLVQFLINVVGQLWDGAAPLRQLTVFYYYQPQQIILNHRWTVEVGKLWNSGPALTTVNVVAVLLGVGFVGYLLALWVFSKRDLPAPL